METIVGCLITAITTLTGSFLIYNHKVSKMKYDIERLSPEHDAIKQSIQENRDRTQNETKDIMNAVFGVDKRLIEQFTAENERTKYLSGDQKALVESVANLNAFSHIMIDQGAELAELKKRCQKLETEISKRDREIQRYKNQQKNYAIEKNQDSDLELD